jgi:hypothetical protein
MADMHGTLIMSQYLQGNFVLLRQAAAIDLEQFAG